MLTFPSPGIDRRLAALALTLALHLVLLYGWHRSNRVQVDGGIDTRSRLQWLLAPKPEPEPPAVPKRRAATEPALAPRQQLPVAAASTREEISTWPDDVAVEAGPAPAVSVLKQARNAVGAVDRTLQQAEKSKLIRAKPVSAQMRLERAMQKAHDMTPNKWYQAPKVTEIIDPGGYGRRRYRVVGANGTYCITIESNRAPDGIDTMQHGIKPKLTNCDDNEQAATKQDW